MGRVCQASAMIRQRLLRAPSKEVAIFIRMVCFRPSDRFSFQDVFLFRPNGFVRVIIRAVPFRHPVDQGQRENVQEGAVKHGSPTSNGASGVLRTNATIAVRNVAVVVNRIRSSVSLDSDRHVIFSSVESFASNGHFSFSIDSSARDMPLRDDSSVYDFSISDSTVSFSDYSGSHFSLGLVLHFSFEQAQTIFSSYNFSTSFSF